MAQKIIAIGNSLGVSIPADIRKQMGLKKGSKVVLELSPDKKGLVIMDAELTNLQEKTPTSKEFKKWLDTFLEENGEILDELAEK